MAATEIKNTNEEDQTTIELSTPQQQPQGRATRVDSENLPSVWGMFFNARTLIALGVSLDEELLFIGIVGAWVWLTAKKVAKGVMAMSPFTAVASVASSWAANETVSATANILDSKLVHRWTQAAPTAFREYITRWEHSKEMNYKLAQRDWVFHGAKAITNSPSFKLSPAKWGIRLTVHQAMLSELTRGEDQWNVSAGRAFITTFTSGAVSEIVARTSTSILRPGGPSLLVEAPYMGLLLGMYGSIRRAFAPDVDPVKDSFCGATSMFLTSLLVHPVRLRVERLRHEHSKSPVYFPRPSSFLPLREVLTIRVPHAAIMFPLFGLLSSWCTPQLKCGGLTGWDYPPELDKFGEPADKREETVAGMLTQRSEVVQSYGYRERRAKAALEAMEAARSERKPDQ